MRGGKKAMEVGFDEQDGSTERSKRLINLPSSMDKMAEILPLYPVSSDRATAISPAILALFCKREIFARRLAPPVSSFTR